MRGAAWVTLRRPALLTLPNGQIGFFVHRKAAHALDASLVFAIVTAIEEQHTLIDRLAALIRRLCYTGANKAAKKNRSHGETTRRRESCFAPAPLRAEYFCAALGDARVRPEDVVCDAGWARVVSLGAMSAEAEARVLLRLRAAARHGAEASESQGEGGGVGGTAGGRWARLARQWQRSSSSLTLSSVVGITYAPLLGAQPFMPLAAPHRLVAVWCFALGGLLCASLFICFYSLQPCEDDSQVAAPDDGGAAEALASAACLSASSSWNVVLRSWCIGLTLEYTLQNPIWIFVRTFMVREAQRALEHARRPRNRAQALLRGSVGADHELDYPHTAASPRDEPAPPAAAPPLRVQLSPREPARLMPGEQLTGTTCAPRAASPRHSPRGGGPVRV